jgi:hypothetical protein
MAASINFQQSIVISSPHSSSESVPSSSSSLLLPLPTLLLSSSSSSFSISSSFSSSSSSSLPIISLSRWQTSIADVIFGIIIPYIETLDRLLIFEMTCKLWHRISSNGIGWSIHQPLHIIPRPYKRSDGNGISGCRGSSSSQVEDGSMRIRPFFVRYLNGDGYFWNRLKQRLNGIGNSNNNSNNNTLTVMTKEMTLKMKSSNSLPTEIVSCGTITNGYDMQSVVNAFQYIINLRIEVYESCIGNGYETRLIPLQHMKTLKSLTIIISSLQKKRSIILPSLLTIEYLSLKRYQIGSQPIHIQLNQYPSLLHFHSHNIWCS